jgi:ABC-2 type transport system ATP-binding protein
MRLTIVDCAASLGGRPIVRIDRLELAGPGWIGIIGANGSGKTTFLRALAGRLKTATGSVMLDGRLLDRAARVAAMGFAPGIEMLPDELTGLDVVSIAARPAGSVAAERLADLLAVLELKSFWHRRVSTYSAGMRQRLAIFAGFVGGQDIVILDEPFNWLDPVVAHDTKRAISNLAAGGTMVISALHDLATLVQCCKAGLVMTEGGVRLNLTPEELSEGKRNVADFEQGIIDSIRNSNRA